MDQFRSLPASKDGRRVVFQTVPGGLLETVADSLEEQLIRMARTDAVKALDLCDRSGTTRAELVMVMRFLAGAVNGLADVAESRGLRAGE